MTLKTPSSKVPKASDKSESSTSNRSGDALKKHRAVWDGNQNRVSAMVIPLDTMVKQMVGVTDQAYVMVNVGDEGPGSITEPADVSIIVCLPANPGFEHVLATRSDLFSGECVREGEEGTVNLDYTVLPLETLKELKGRIRKDVDNLMGLARDLDAGRDLTAGANTLKNQGASAHGTKGGGAKALGALAGLGVTDVGSHLTAAKEIEALLDQIPKGTPKKWGGCYGDPWLGSDVTKRFQECCEDAENLKPIVLKRADDLLGLGPVVPKVVEALLGFGQEGVEAIVKAYPRFDIGHTTCPEFEYYGESQKLGEALGACQHPMMARFLIGMSLSSYRKDRIVAASGLGLQNGQDTLDALFGLNADEAAECKGPAFRALLLRTEPSAKIHAKSLLLSNGPKTYKKELQEDKNPEHFPWLEELLVGDQFTLQGRNRYDMVAVLEAIDARVEPGGLKPNSVAVLRKMLVTCADASDRRLAMQILEKVEALGPPEDVGITTKISMNPSLMDLMRAGCVVEFPDGHYLSGRPDGITIGIDAQPIAQYELDGINLRAIERILSGHKKAGGK